MFRVPKIGKIIFLQYIKKKVWQLFLCSRGMQNIQIIYGCSVVFVVTCLSGKLKSFCQIELLSPVNISKLGLQPYWKWTPTKIYLRNFSETRDDMLHNNNVKIYFTKDIKKQSFSKGVLSPTRLAFFKRI